MTSSPRTLLPPLRRLHTCAFANCRNTVLPLSHPDSSISKDEVASEHAKSSHTAGSTFLHCVLSMCPQIVFAPTTCLLHIRRLGRLRPTHVKRWKFGRVCERFQAFDTGWPIYSLQASGCAAVLNILIGCATKLQWCATISNIQTGGVRLNRVGLLIGF